MPDIRIKTAGMNVLVMCQNICKLASVYSAFALASVYLQSRIKEGGDITFPSYQSKLIIPMHQRKPS